MSCQRPDPFSWKIALLKNDGKADVLIFFCLYKTKNIRLNYQYKFLSAQITICDGRLAAKDLCKHPEPSLFGQFSANAMAKKMPLSA